MISQIYVLSFAPLPGVMQNLVFAKVE